jgi:hypothetical protein
MAEAMTWAFQLLAFFEKGLGSETVLQRLQDFANNKQFTTMFSGMDCHHLRERLQVIKQRNDFA